MATTRNPEARDDAEGATYSVGANETTGWIRVGPDVTVDCTPSGGTVKCQAWFGHLDLAGTGVTGQDWTAGASAARAVERLINATQVRFITAGGATATCCISAAAPVR